MEPYELSDFAKRLQEIEESVSFLSANESDIALFGLPYFAKREEIEDNLAKLKSFPADKSEFLRIAKIVDTETHEEALRILEQYKLEQTLLKLAVKISVAKKKKPRNRFSFQLASLLKISRYTAGLVGKKDFLSSEGGIDLEETLAGLSILIAQVERTSDIYFRKHRWDSDVFTPSNIDISLVHQHIELTIQNISGANITPSDKERLLEHLEEIKVELAKESPAWKKIVGGLAIAAAIIGGIATLPQAAENITKAYEHIMGTSIPNQQHHFQAPNHNLLPDSKESSAGGESAPKAPEPFDEDIPIV